MAEPQNPDRISAVTLTRKVGEAIHIGENIVITIGELNTRSKTVKVRVSAPRSTSIYRAEIINTVTEGNLIAATSDADDAEFLLEL